MGARRVTASDRRYTHEQTTRRNETAFRNTKSATSTRKAAASALRPAPNFSPSLLCRAAV